MILQQQVKGNGTKSVYGYAGLGQSPCSFTSPKSTQNLQESFKGKAREQAHVPAVQSYHLHMEKNYFNYFFSITLHSNVKEKFFLFFNFHSLNINSKADSGMMFVL